MTDRVGQIPRSELLALTFNGSYLEAIAADLALASPPTELTSSTPTLLLKLGQWTPDDNHDLPRSGLGYRRG